MAKKVAIACQGGGMYAAFEVARDSRQTAIFVEV